MLELLYRNPGFASPATTEKPILPCIHFLLSSLFLLLLNPRRCRHHHLRQHHQLRLHPSSSPSLDRPRFSPSRRYEIVASFKLEKPMSSLQDNMDNLKLIYWMRLKFLMLRFLVQDCRRRFLTWN